jgi:molecular chaperone DnaJ
MELPDHYQTLEVNHTASQVEIKRAYRRLAKLFHPDSQSQTANHEQITRVNAAYEVLGDPQRRSAYDQQRQQVANLEAAGFSTSRDRRSRQQRAADAQRQYHQRQTGQDADAHLQLWLKSVYRPVNRLISKILTPLKAQVRELSADPFDDDLMGNFQAYLEQCRDWLKEAQSMFQSMPNPGSVASVAAHLYYCLNQVEDGIEELERFTLNYDDSYLHTGQELFRISRGLRQEAQAALKEVL